MLTNLFKSERQIILEIHNDFDTTEDRLLQQAEKIIASTEIPGISKIEEKASRLKALGFVRSEEVSVASHYTKRRKETKDALVKTKEQAKLIQYYKQTYPFQKFLTEKELDRICEKYNLIHAPVENYKGIVPEKNLRDIENAKPLHRQDVQDKRYIWRYTGPFTKEATSVEKLLCRDGIDITEKVKSEWRKEMSGSVISSAYFNNRDIFQYNMRENETEEQDLSGLFIAAPKSHFDLSGLKNKGQYGYGSVTIRKVKDPIVFRYVKGGIQVLTKWGLEASDELLVNEINN